jgi:hypothetical protein
MDLCLYHFPVFDQGFLGLYRHTGHPGPDHRSVPGAAEIYIKGIKTDFSDYRFYIYR